MRRRMMLSAQKDYFTEQELLDMGFLISRNKGDTIRFGGRGGILNNGTPVVVGAGLQVSGSGERYVGFILISNNAIAYVIETNFGDAVEITLDDDYKIYVMKFSWDEKYCLSGDTLLLNGIECRNDYSLLKITNINETYSYYLDEEVKEFIAKIIKSCAYLE